MKRRSMLPAAACRHLTSSGHVSCGRSHARLARVVATAAPLESLRVKLWRVAIATCVLASAAPLVLAQNKLGSPHEERFRLSAGLFSADTDTDIRLDADDGTLGTAVSAEEDLGLADHSDVGDV